MNGHVASWRNSGATVLCFAAWSRSANRAVVAKPREIGPIKHNSTLLGAVNRECPGGGEVKVIGGLWRCLGSMLGTMNRSSTRQCKNQLMLLVQCTHASECKVILVSDCDVGLAVVLDADLLSRCRQELSYTSWLARTCCI
jgi:hypothetical protein